MEVLLHGIEYTSQLQLLLSQNKNFVFGDGCFQESALDLTKKIHQSFLDALFQHNTTTNSSGNVQTISLDEVVTRHHDQSTLSTNTTGVSSFSKSDDGKSSCGSSKAIFGSSTDTKIGFKKRQTTLNTWAKITSTLVDDGYTWRKHGQKEIHNTEFPRSYYRCAHKNEEGCQATKQVQQTHDKPSMYKTTYMGQHTCKPTETIILNSTDFMLDETHDSSCIINFQTNLTTKPTTLFPSFHKNESLKSSTTKSHEQYNITPISDDNDFTMSDEFLLSSDLSAFDSISREVHELMGVQQNI